MKRPHSGNVTIVDIARHLQLSPSAVSQALWMRENSTTKVSQETVQAVRELAQKWNYRPNSSARRMKGQPLHQAGFIMEYRFENRRIPWINMPASLGVSDYLVSRKWHLNIIQDGRDEEKDSPLPHYLEENTLDGIILSSCSTPRDASIMEDLKKFNIPFVLLNGPGEYNAVTLDDSSGITMAMQHLFELGHKKIVYIGDPQKFTSHNSSVIREQSYVDNMNAAGLEPNIWLYNVMQPGPTQPEADRHRTDEIHKQELYNNMYLPIKPTAVACGSDIDAMLLCQILLEKGVRIPEDVSVVGYNDLPFLNLFYPPLTTVRVNFYELGFKSAEMLLKLLDDKVDKIPSVTVQPELIVRRSTGAPRR